MNASPMVIVSIAMVVHVTAPDSDYIPKGWVDPNDMRNYDRFSKSMKYKDDPPHAWPTCSANDENYPLSNLIQQTMAEEEVHRYKIFLERFINRFLLTAHLHNKEMTPRTRITTEVPVRITSEELSRLKFLSEHIDVSILTELDAIFSAVLSLERGFSFDSLTPYLNPVQQLFTDMSWEKITIVIFVVVSSIVLWMFAVGRELKRILIFLYLIFFMSGLAWNWWYLYQEAVVEQYVAMKKLSHIPDACAPKVSSFFGYFFSSSNDHECVKYHKAFRVNPFSKVPPSIILSETISGMLIHPLKSIGSGVGELLIGINRSASWPLNIIFLPFVFITLLVFAFCILLICVGRKMNVWTLFGGISIGDRAAAPVGENGNLATSKITDVKDLERILYRETEHAFVLTQVGTIKKYMEIELKTSGTLFVRPSVSRVANWDRGDAGSSSSVFDWSQRHQSSSVVFNRNQEDSAFTLNTQNVDTHREDTGSQSYITQQSKDILEMFRYLPKKKIPSSKTLSMKCGIRKRYK